MKRTTLGAIGLAVAGTLSLTGCKNGNEEAGPVQSGSPATQPSQTAPSEQPSAPASPSTGTGGGGEAPGGAPAGAAKPGQTFKIGESATVPFKYGTTTNGTIALTVTAVEQGQAADLEPLKLGDKVKGMVPYYIRYTVKNVGTTDLAYASVGHIKGLLPDGSEAQGVSVIGKFEKCKDDSLPKGFTGGKTQTNCAIALAPSAETKVVGAEYWGDPYNNLNDSKPLYWK
ncbi:MULTISPECIES: hypothetical protein [unclassified Streptomyces]|uniref:hypothetical protein n=1 Tax=unclassified Streptomyces TaxID=2593676 RepID=UPI0022543F61|nr:MULTISPECIES: hypothetical protein [unclassified Streptomyces]MCX4528473.1 hypothetical protein [Streptomyces sp. NBC_01551]MCX4540929.1 hypothetical protein [Streptomyces sp. NBC_01565]